MRIIQTSNIHLDRSFADLELPSGPGAACRRHLFDTLTSILGRAVEWPADAVVICGDLFDFERVTRTTVKELRDALAEIQPIPVIICPGRADACQPGSPYLTEHWPSNVHCFKTPAWESVALDSVPLTIYGFGWDRPDYNGGLPMPLEIENPNRSNLAFGYGLAGRLIPGEQPDEFRFDPPVELPSALDYLGLGESPVGKRVDVSTDTVAAYSGAPVVLDFEGDGRGEYLELEVEQPGAPVTVTPQCTSKRLFGSLTVDCSVLDSGQGLIDAVRQEVDALGGVPFLRLTLKGDLPRHVYAELEGIYETLADSVQYLQLRDTCQIAEDYDSIGREHTSLGAYIARINAEIDDAPSRSVRAARLRSRDLGLSAYRGTALPVRGLTGDRP